MKFANVKGMLAKGTLLAVAAAALAVASPSKAQAQRVVFGVRVAQPYYAPRYDHRYDRFDRYEFARRQAFIRHEEWLRARHYDRSYGYR